MTPIEKIYYAFYISRKERLYFNELKKYSSLLDSSLSKNIKELIRNNQIKQDKQKSNTYYSLVNKDIKASYFTYFSIVKLENLDLNIKIPLKDFISKINNVKYIIHFGSTSRNDQTKNSDIDLLIVLENYKDDNLNSLYQKEIKKEINNIIKNIHTIFSISCFFITQEEFINSKDNLIISAKNIGYPIYNQINYFQKIKWTLMN